MIRFGNSPTSELKGRKEGRKEGRKNLHMFLFA